MKKVVIELVKNGKVFRRFLETSKTLDRRLKEIRERYHFDELNLKW